MEGTHSTIVFLSDGETQYPQEVGHKLHQTAVSLSFFRTSATIFLSKQ